MATRSLRRPSHNPISGKEVSLNDAGPPESALRHTLALLKEGKPIKVLAMPPFDQLIGPALTQLYPGAKVTVSAWPTEGQSLAQLELAAKKVRTMAMDLVLIAVPASAAGQWTGGVSQAICLDHELVAELWSAAVGCDRGTAFRVQAGSHFR